MPLITDALMMKNTSCERRSMAVIGLIGSARTISAKLLLPYFLYQLTLATT